jgi:hypothetical protein
MKKSLVLTAVLFGLASFSLSAAENVVVKDTKAVVNGAGKVVDGSVKAAGKVGGAVLDGTVDAAHALGRGVDKGVKAVTPH